MTLMQYLQKQYANRGLEVLKSSPVFLKGLCLLMIYIQDLIIKLYILSIAYPLQTYKLSKLMFGLLIQTFSNLFGTPSYNICILGIEQTGKTVLFNSIKNIHQPLTLQKKQARPYQATIGLNFTKYQNNQDKFTVWDLGGKPNIRKIWQSYYSQCHGLIFVINQRFQEGLAELKRVFSHQQMFKIPFCIILTKQHTKDEVHNLLKQADWLGDRKYIIYELLITHIPTSKALIKDILHWLYSSIRELHLTLRQ